MTPRTSRSVVVTTLGVTQTLSWGSSYYLTAVFADPVSIGLGMPKSWYFAMVSVSLLLSGLLGPWAGRMIDERGGRGVLAGTNVIFAAGLVLMGLAPGPVGLALAWLVIGIGMGFGLYEAAFATAAGLYGRDARNAITGITLVAGFASTVGWPASAFFIEQFGWRGACFAWAALHLLVGLPLNRFLVPKAPPPPPVEAHTEATGGVSATMIVLAAVFAATWFVAGAMAAHLPRLLTALGVAPVAAIAAASLVGPAQVAARVLEFTVLRRGSPLLSARVAALGHPVGAAALAIFGAPAAVFFVLLHGGGNGIMTIARGTLPLAMFGPAGYGLRTGILAAPTRLLQGGAPLLFELVLNDFGPYGALALSGALTGASFLLLMLIRPPRDHGA